MNHTLPEFDFECKKFGLDYVCDNNDDGDDAFDDHNLIELLKISGD